LRGNTKRRHDKGKGRGRCNRQRDGKQNNNPNKTKNERKKEEINDITSKKNNKKDKIIDSPLYRSEGVSARHRPTRHTVSNLSFTFLPPLISKK
jgi:hypothetical protein